MYDFLYVMYTLSATFFILVAFACVLFTLETLFDRKDYKWHDKFNPTHLKRVLAEKPIRSGLALVAIMDFLAVTIPYLIPVDLSPEFIWRSIVFRIFVLAGSLIVVWISSHIKRGDWKINNGQWDIERKEG